jgi:tetratricopeptide (TPR) repeat protein
MNRSLAAAGLCYGLVIGLAAGLAAAEPASAGPAPSTAELPLVFDEDMSSLPNERFQSLGPGGLEWKQNSHWTIKAPAVFARQVKAGRDAHLAIRMEFPRLKDGEKSETRLGLIFLNNQVGVVTFLRQREGEKTTGQILVHRQPDVVQQIGDPLRKIDLKEDLPAGNWTLQLRAGALTIATGGKAIGRATLETHTTPIVGFAVAQPSASVNIQRLTFRGTTFPAELSGQQKEQALAAARLNDEAGRLLRSKQHVEALEKARQVVPMYEKLYGRDHHDVANALFNLGMVLKHGGELPESVKAFEEALAVRRRLFGVDHPDTAQVEMELTVVLVDLMRLEAAFPHCMAAHFSFAEYYGEENRSTILSRQILDKLPRPKREDET